MPTVWAHEAVKLLRTGKVQSGLHVKDSLELRDVDLVALPPDMSIAGNMVLQNLPQLRSLPRGLHVAGTLVLDYCERLEAIPSTVCVNGAVWINDCHSITETPRNAIEFCTELQISNCESFQMLPENTTYQNGSVTLLNCNSLTALPEKMTVYGRLRVNRCANFRRIPATLCIKSRLPEHMRTQSWVERVFGKQAPSYGPPFSRVDKKATG